MSIRLCCCLLIGVLSAGVVRADDAPASAPATAPAAGAAASTAPAATQPALSPRQVLKLISAAMLDGDADALRTHLYGRNDTEKKMVEAVAELASALAKMRQAAITKLGAEAARPVTGDLEAQRRAIAALDEATERVMGDIAIVMIGADPPDMVMLDLIDGRWVSPIRMATRAALEGQELQWLEQTRARAAVCQSVTENILDGSLKTADQILLALDERVRMVVVKPTTAPAVP